ncbi:hypothetical protein DYB32_009325 [Aphanomyces invadans]|uniref:Uncharacterized protein n=1 Tax=Aphanomyces invadans TaxID=157072 RepID=A0A3R7A342_9STRA|nr:hypothetical protein DYB32_009325 [Aphanomyces invadans]
MLDEFIKVLKCDIQEWILKDEAKVVVDLWPRRAGVATQVVVDDTPTALYPYGKEPKLVMLSRCLCMSVTLTTTCGPLLLRGVPIWIDDEADDDVALNVSRDMSDSEFLPSAEVAVNQVSRSHLIVLDDDPVARMECSPVVDMLPGESKEDLRRRCEAMVKAILVAKVEDARSLGLRDEEVVRLKQLQAKFVDVLRTNVRNDPRSCDGVWWIRRGTTVVRDCAFNDQGTPDFDWLDKSRIKHVQNLQSSLDEMHRDVSARSKKSYVAKRELDTRRKNPETPKQGVQIDELWLVQRGSERHGEDLEDHAAYGEGGFHVEDLLATRVVNGQHEILEDVPVQLRKWVLSQKHDDGVEAMQEALELTLGHLL